MSVFLVILIGWLCFGAGAAWGALFLPPFLRELAEAIERQEADK